MSTARIIWTGVGVSLTVVILLTATVWGYRMRPADEPCRSLTYIIEDIDERHYVTPGDLNAILMANELYPIGRPLDAMTLHRIETTIAHHPMVRTAECYMTPQNDMRVRLTQRVPLLRVNVPGDAYIIDTDRRVMQARAVVRDSVMLVTGAVGVQMASGPLADFAQWLQDEPYWRQRIRYVYVASPQMIYLYIRGEKATRIVMGNLRNYESKLAKLRTFLENSAEATRDKEYYEYDVRFRGQVIGRKAPNNQ